jgi:hypothetical protein
MQIEINPWNNPIDPDDILTDEVEWLLAECDFETYIAFGLAYINEKIQKVLWVEWNPDTNEVEENGMIQEQLVEAFKKSFLEIRAATELQQILLKWEVTEENDKIFRQTGIDFKNSVIKARKAWDEIADNLINETRKQLSHLNI